MDDPHLSSRMERGASYPGQEIIAKLAFNI
jgi:hypothetical protein